MNNQGIQNKVFIKAGNPFLPKEDHTQEVEEEDVDTIQNVFDIILKSDNPLKEDVVIVFAQRTRADYGFLKTVLNMLEKNDEYEEEDKTRISTAFELMMKGEIEWESEEEAE